MSSIPPRDPDSLRPGERIAGRMLLIGHYVMARGDDCYWFTRAGPAQRVYSIARHVDEFVVMGPTRALEPGEKLTEVAGNVSCAPLPPCWWHLILWPYSLLRMIGECRRADVVRIRIQEYMYLPATLAAWLTRRPMYFYIGASPVSSALTSPRLSWAAPLKRVRAIVDQWLVRMVIRGRVVICSDRRLAEELRPYAARSFGFRMSNVLQPDDFVDPETINCDWQDPVTVLVVATLNPGKGIQDLMRAMAALRAEGHQLALRLAGDGGYRPALESLAAELGMTDAVTFLGFVGREQLHEEYANADIFCLPSHSEGSPKVIPEAMAAGLPTVSTDVGNVTNIIEDGVTGLVCQPKDVEGLTAALRRLLEDRQFALSVARAGRESMEGTGLDADSREFMGVVAKHLGLKVVSDQAEA